MKLIILAILCTSIFALNSHNQGRLESEDQDVFYTFSSPANYSASPVSYSYVPATYYYTYDPFFGYYGSSYYVDYTYVVYPFYYRGEAPSKSATNTKEKKEATRDDIQSELSNLKKEIWGNENFDTVEIRTNKKAYDSRWLIAQLKITRALELEDNLKKITKKREAETENNNEVELETDEEMRKNTTLKGIFKALKPVKKNTTVLVNKAGKKSRDEEDNLDDSEDFSEMESESDSEEMRRNKTKAAAKNATAPVKAKNLGGKRVSNAKITTEIIVANKNGKKSREEENLDEENFKENDSENSDHFKSRSEFESESQSEGKPKDSKNKGNNIKGGKSGKGNKTEKKTRDEEEN